MTGPIVAATDFSARADRAVDRAIMLGEELGLDVQLVHALEYSPGRETDTAALDQRMRSVLPRTNAAMKFFYPEGSVPAAIAGHAEDVDAAMIVMGVARYNSVGDFFLGTAVDRVIRGTSKPVIVVKSRPRGAYRKVLAVTDFSKPSRQAINWIIAVFPEAELHLLHAYSVPFEAWNKAEYVAEEIKAGAQKRLAELLADLPENARQRTCTHAVRGNLCSAANRIEGEEAIDLIAVGSHGETGFRHATIGSQASAVLENGQADTVLIGPRVA